MLPLLPPRSWPEQTAEAAVEPAPPGEGWERRFVTDARRAEEHRELYESLGYETRVVAADPGAFGPDCEPCTTTTPPVALYTRPRGHADETKGSHR